VRLAGIEGLRAVAASSIVLVHVWSTSMPHGVVLGSGARISDAPSTMSAGVTLFFTLSGFLLYRQFAAPTSAWPRTACSFPVASSSAVAQELAFGA
jgi:peptidoglycan/LPS O-acetylase OafA/YrhL